MFFHKMLDRSMAKVNALTPDYFEQQRQDKKAIIKKEKQLDEARKERVASMDYKKELERTDLTHKQRMFYSKMAEWQKKQND